MTEQPGIRAHRIGPPKNGRRYTYNLSIFDDFLTAPCEELHGVTCIFAMTRNLSNISPNRERLTLVPSMVAATCRSSRSARHAGGRGAGSWVVGVGGVDDLGHGVVDDGGQASWPAGSPVRRPSPRTRTWRPGRGTRLRR